MEREITITKSYNLRFKLGVFNHLKEITGQDGISFIQTAVADIVHGCYALILAAARCYTDKHGGTVNEVDLKKEIAEDGDMELFNKVVEMYTEFINPNAKAEATPAKPSPSPRFKNSPMDSLESAPGN